MSPYECVNRILTFKSIIQITTIIGLLLFFGVTWPTIYTDYPYESWDEIFTYNSSRQVFHKKVVFAYGSLDIGQQLIANWWYDNFDVVGKAHPVKSFA